MCSSYSKVFELCLCKTFLFTENGWSDNRGGMGPFVDVNVRTDGLRAISGGFSSLEKIVIT